MLERYCHRRGSGIVRLNMLTAGFVVPWVRHSQFGWIMQAFAAIAPANVNAPAPPPECPPPIALQGSEVCQDDGMERTLGTEVLCHFDSHLAFYLRVYLFSNRATCCAIWLIFGYFICVYICSRIGSRVAPFDLFLGILFACTFVLESGHVLRHLIYFWAFYLRVHLFSNRVTCCAI